MILTHPSSNASPSHLGSPHPKQDDVSISQQPSSHEISADSVPRIVLAEDDDEMRKLLSRRLRQSGYDVDECANGMELLHRIERLIGAKYTHRRSDRIDLIVSDVRMPGVLGLSVAEGVKKRDDFPPIILITAFPDQAVYDSARASGVHAVLAKPFETDILIRTVDDVLGTCP